MSGVRFNHTVKVILVPSRREYDSLRSDLWYSITDYKEMLDSLKRDIKILNGFFGDSAITKWKEINCKDPSKLKSNNIAYSSPSRSNSNHGIFGFV